MHASPTPPDCTLPVPSRCYSDGCHSDGSSRCVGEACAGGLRRPGVRRRGAPLAGAHSAGRCCGRGSATSRHARVCHAIVGKIYINLGQLECQGLRNPSGDSLPRQERDSLHQRRRRLTSYQTLRLTVWGRRRPVLRRLPSATAAPGCTVPANATPLQRQRQRQQHTATTATAAATPST